MNFLHTEYDSEPDDSLEKSMSLVASAISDPSRVSILCALMDGRAWTATELSAVAGIASELPLVEAARAAADGGDLAAYISAQGGANVPRDEQTVRTARQVIDELNEYDEEIQKIIGVYAPHLGTDLIHETRTTKWRIVTKAVEVAVHPLNLISASGAPRSPVNNCGEVQREPDPDMQVATPEYVTAVMNLIECGDVSWNDADVAKTMRDALRQQSLKGTHQEIARNRKKSRNDAPSARLTPAERARIPQIRLELALHGVTPERWELRALVRGAVVNYDDQNFSHPLRDEWPGFSQ